MYLYALEVLQNMNISPLIATDDLYNSPYEKYCFGIITTYEGRYLEKGTKINYLKVMILAFVKNKINYELNHKQALFCIKTILLINKKIFKI